MITDNTIADDTAKYWCAFAKCEFEDTAAAVKEEMKKDTAEKTAIKAAIAVRQDGNKTEKRLDEGIIDFIKAVWNSPPAWVDEPTGFNLCSPEKVFRDDVQAGIRGYHDGEKAALTTIAAVGTACIPGVKTAVKKIASTAAKNAVPAAKTVASATVNAGAAALGAAAANPGAAATVAAAVTAAAKNPKETKKIIDRIKEVISWCSNHAVSLSVCGSIAYGLFQTYPLWIPYVKRLAYEATCGKPLAYVEFDSGDTSYRFEYSQNKHMWRLLNSGKLSSAEDSSTFIKTEFAQKFIKRCEQIVKNAVDHLDMLKSQAQMSGCKPAMEAAIWLESNKSKLESRMFKGKISIN